MASYEVFSNSKDSFYGNRELRQATIDDVTTLTPPFPKTALIELSNWCNHACVFCTNPRMVRQKGFLNIQVYERFIREAIEAGLEEVGLYTTGEPFFTKNLDEFVAIAKRAGARYIYVTSNGALATPDRVVPVIEAGLSSIKFSINAGSKETYQFVHGKDDFDKVLQNVRFVSDYRKNKAPHLRIFASCVVTKFVENEKEILKELLLPLVDDLAFFGVGGQAGQSLDELVLLESSMTGTAPPMGQAKPCSMLWNRIHLTHEGYLNLCCIDYENALTYADLNSGISVLEAWNNQVIQEMRRRHQTQDLSGTLCQNCLYNTREKVLPLTQIGHVVSQPIESRNEKGVRSVLDRIDHLSQKI